MVILFFYLWLLYKISEYLYNIVENYRLYIRRFEYARPDIRAVFKKLWIDEVFIRMDKHECEYILYEYGFLTALFEYIKDKNVDILDYKDDNKEILYRLITYNLIVKIINKNDIQYCVC